jgi:hypothetical protein
MLIDEKKMEQVKKIADASSPVLSLLPISGQKLYLSSSLETNASRD